jgi:hypothetical protein
LPVVAPGLYTHWHSDLADFRSIKRFDKTYAYLLVCIDCFSRQLFLEPVKQKTADAVTSAYKTIFKRSKFVPWYIYTDQGNEFIGHAVKQLFAIQKIFYQFMYTWPEIHACMAERVIRTIKERLY